MTYTEDFLDYIIASLKKHNEALLNIGKPPKPKEPDNDSQRN